MGFEINYGSPGLFGIVIVVMLVFLGMILVTALFRSAKDAHDEVVQEIEDEGGDLRA